MGDGSMRGVWPAVAVLVAAAAVCAALLWTAAEARRDARRTEAAIERVETELRWARTARGG